MTGHHICCYSLADGERILTKLGQVDHRVSSEMSYDFDLCLTFDLDIRAKNRIFLLDTCVISL